MLPLLYVFVIAVDQHIGNRHASVFAWASELRMLKQTGMTEGIITAAGFVVENSGNQPDDCIYYQHGRYFTAIADKIADRNFERPEPLSDPIVKPFIPPTKEQQSRFA